MALTHLLKRRDFKAAAETGRRFRSSALTVQLRDRAEDGTGLRLGLTASRHAGNAVRRNRIRRRLRAAAEQAFAAAAARPVDVVLVARPEAVSAPFAALVSDLARSLEAARAPSGGRRR